MWYDFSVKYKFCASGIIVGLLYVLSMTSYSVYMHRYGFSRINTEIFPPAPKHSLYVEQRSRTKSIQLSSTDHYSKTLSKHLLSNLAQYNRRIIRLSPVELPKKRSNTKKKVRSKFEPTSLKFTVLTTSNILKNSSLNDALSLLLMVTDKDNKTVKGCSFDAVQIFYNDTPQLKALCTVEDLHNGRYKVLCQKHGKTQCFKLTVLAQYCHYEAFRQSPCISMWNHEVLRRNFCFPEASSRVSNVPGESSPSWTLDPHGHCDNLRLHNYMVHALPDNDTCACIDKQFDNVYLIGTSHMRIVAEYLMHKCCNKDFSNISVHHGSMEALNIHYYSWSYFELLRHQIHKSLNTWFRNSNSIAIWVETGSHDFAEIGYEYTMAIGLEHFNQTLAFIQNRVRNSSAMVDLRVLASPPMPDGWYLNNFAIGAFNAKLQLICLVWSMTLTM